MTPSALPCDSYHGAETIERHFNHCSKYNTIGTTTEPGAGCSKRATEQASRLHRSTGGERGASRRRQHAPRLRSAWKKDGIPPASERRSQPTTRQSPTTRRFPPESDRRKPSLVASSRISEPGIDPPKKFREASRISPGRGGDRPWGWRCGRGECGRGSPPAEGRARRPPRWCPF